MHAYRFPRSRNLIEFLLMYISNDHIYLSDEGKDFLNTMNRADIVIHSPGGPLSDDIYSWAEFVPPCCLLLALCLKTGLYILTTYRTV